MKKGWKDEALEHAAKLSGKRGADKRWGYKNALEAGVKEAFSEMEVTIHRSKDALPNFCFMQGGELQFVVARNAHNHRNSGGNTSASLQKQFAAELLRKGFTVYFYSLKKGLRKGFLSYFKGKTVVRTVALPEEGRG